MNHLPADVLASTTASFWKSQGLELTEMDARVLTVLDQLANNGTNGEQDEVAQLFQLLHDHFVSVLQQRDLTQAAYDAAIKLLDAKEELQ